MEGQQYYTINPDTFVDSDLWSYRDLQKLAKAVGIKANVDRLSLISNLQTWHRLRKNGTQTLVETGQEGKKVENFDMNVIGNNFAILAVNVKENTSQKSTSSKRRISIVGLGDNESGIVSPTLLRPLRPEPGTPGKSCLKKPKLSSNQESSLENSSPSNRMEPVTPTTKRLSNICFSPFNSVKVIAHRDELAWDEYVYQEEQLYLQQLENEARKEEDIEKHNRYLQQQKEMQERQYLEKQRQVEDEPAPYFSPAKSLLRFCASLIA